MSVPKHWLLIGRYPRRPKHWLLIGWYPGDRNTDYWSDDTLIDRNTDYWFDDTLGDRNTDYWSDDTLVDRNTDYWSDDTLVDRNTVYWSDDNLETETLITDYWLLIKDDIWRLKVHQQKESSQWYQHANRYLIYCTRRVSRQLLSVLFDNWHSV